jgi:HSP20 family protein
MSELANLHSAMDRLFDEFFGGRAGVVEGRMEAPTLYLPIDVQELKDRYRIQAPVPGFKPDDVDVTFSDGVLTIRAQRAQKEAEAQGSYLRRELVHAHYVRSIQLPADVKAQDIKASFENGMLMVEVPRTARREPTRIPIAKGEKT